MTKNKILDAGIKAWKKNPDSVTASNIGRMIGITHAAVLYHFPKGVKNAVAEYAIEKGEKKIVAQLIALGHPSTKNMTKEEKQSFMSDFAS